MLASRSERQVGSSGSRSSDALSLSLPRPTRRLCSSPLHLLTGRTSATHSYHGCPHHRRVARAPPPRPDQCQLNRDVIKPSLERHIHRRSQSRDCHLSSSCDRGGSVKVRSAPWLRLRWYRSPSLRAIFWDRPHFFDGTLAPPLYSLCSRRQPRNTAAMAICMRKSAAHPINLRPAHVHVNLAARFTTRRDLARVFRISLFLSLLFLHLILSYILVTGSPSAVDSSPLRTFHSFLKPTLASSRGPSLLISSYPLHSTRRTSLPRFFVPRPLTHTRREPTTPSCVPSP